ncbi:MAG: hypothetical protein ACQKBU_04485 [Verrucomicrobiales bacterium]
MAHESTFAITFGGVALVSQGDLVETEPSLRRTPNTPAVSRPIGASSARFYGGLGLSHSLSWTIRREFATLAAARTYEWTRPTALPEGKQTLTITDSGITTTLSDAHIVDFGLTHSRGCVVIETVSIVGGAYTSSGSTVEPADPATPDEPVELPVDGHDPAGFLLLEGGGNLLLEWTASPLRLEQN